MTYVKWFWSPTFEAWYFHGKRMSVWIYTRSKEVRVIYGLYESYGYYSEQSEDALMKELYTFLADEGAL